MKVKILALVACLVMPFQLATAGIAADFKSGMSMDKIMTKAVDKDGMSIEDAVAEMVTLHPELVGLIVAEAVKRYPSLVAEIVVAAAVAAPKFKDEIALAAGVDKKVVEAAIAAAKTGGIPSAVTIVVTALVPFPAAGAGNGVSPN